LARAAPIGADHHNQGLARFGGNAMRLGVSFGGFGFRGRGLFRFGGGCRTNGRFRFDGGFRFGGEEGGLQEGCAENYRHPFDSFFA
jgi:hypothetical protein